MLLATLAAIDTDSGIAVPEGMAVELLQVAPGNVGLIAGQPGDPRTWGATVKFSF